MSVDIAPSGATPGQETSGPPGTPTGATASVSGTVTAPAAGAAIATTGALAAGNYEVNVFVTTSATDVENMELKVGATVIGPIPENIGAGVLTEFRVLNPAGVAITVNAIANGTAAVVYTATIVYTPVV